MTRNSRGARESPVRRLPFTSDVYGLRGPYPSGGKLRSVRRPKLSLVVPFYGVERYIAECLDSLREQSLADLEVILVDDGSPDDSLTIAEKYAAEDARFQIVRQENQGLGPARNTGAARATGEYLAFVDSDDVVPPHAYERMVSALEASGSDMAAGNARRFNDLGVRESWSHRVAFANAKRGTHVTRFTPLTMDRMAWNKVYRRSFWDEHRFAYPAGLYEDYPVTIRSHVLARRVDVIANPIYYWRERDGGDLSITQRVWEIDNLRQRVASADSVLDFLDAEAPGLAVSVHRYLLQIDLGAVVAALHKHDPADHAEVLSLAQHLLGRFSQEAIDTSRPFDRVQAALVHRGALAELAQLVDHRARHGVSGPLRRSGPRWRPRYHRELPFLGDPGVGIPDEVYEVRGERLTLGGAVHDVCWDRDAVVLDARIGVDQLQLGEDTRVRGWLVAPDGGRRPVTLVHAVRTTRPHQLDVRLRLEPALLTDVEDGVHEWIELELRVGGLRYRGRLSALDGHRTRWSEQREIAPGVWAKPTKHRGAFGVRVRRPDHLVTGVRAEGEGLVITGLFTLPAGSDPAVEPALWFRVGNAADVVPAGVERIPGEPGDPAGTGRFEARLDARSVASHGLHDAITERAVWRARLAVAAEPPGRLLAPAAVGTASAVVGGRRVSLVCDADGHLCVHEEYAHPVVDDVEIEAEELRVHGRFDRAGERPRTARLRRYVTPADPVVLERELTWRDDRFTVAFPLAELVRAAAGIVVEDETGEPTPWQLLMPDPVDGRAERTLLDLVEAARLPRVLRERAPGVRIDLGRMAQFGVVVTDG